MAVAMEVDEVVTPGSGKKLMVKSEKRKKKRKSQIGLDDSMEITKAVESEPDWTVRTVSGLDLLSCPPSVTPDSSHVVVASGDKVLVYAAATGHMVRSLATGEVLAATAGSDGEVVVAGRRIVSVWDYRTVRSVGQYPMFVKEGKEELNPADIQEICIPENFKFTVFVTVKSGNNRPLYRVNLKTKDSPRSVVRIFKNIKPGSVHVGDGGNCVCAIGHVQKEGNDSAALIVYDQNLSKVNKSFRLGFSFQTFKTSLT